jgi:hypothetical protein
VGTDVGQDGVEAGTQGVVLRRVWVKQESTLQRSQQGECEGVGVGVRAQVTAGAHACQAGADRRFPSLEAGGAGMRVFIGDFGRDRTDWAAPT